MNGVVASIVLRIQFNALIYTSRKNAHSSFSSLVQSLLPKDTLLRTYLCHWKARCHQKIIHEVFYDKAVELTLTFQFLADAECIVKDNVLHF